MKFKTALLTLFVAIDLSDDDLARGAELLLGLLCELVPDGGEHVGEAAPVRVEVDEHELVVGWKEIQDYHIVSYWTCMGSRITIQQILR